jgi:MraZ protein
MFRGQFQHAIDAKGRIALPARFRDGIAAEPSGGGIVIVTPALFDPCLHVFPLGAWEHLEEKIAELPAMDPHVVRFRRLYVSAACECEVDKAGRLLIPSPLRQRVHLDREGLWAGMGRHLELWSKDQWDASLCIHPDEEALFKQSVLERIKI